MLAAYRALIDSGLDSRSIVVAGDSAGAGLALALAQRLRDGAGPLPGGLVLLNGWLDLTNSGPSIEANRRRDVGVARVHLDESAATVRGRRRAHSPRALSPQRRPLRATADVPAGGRRRHPARATPTGWPSGRERPASTSATTSTRACGTTSRSSRGCCPRRTRRSTTWAGHSAGSGLGAPWRRAPASTPTVAIIGAGFGGIGLGISLRRAGIESFEIFEKAEGVGGVWRDNTYPGLTCDIPSHLYSFSFEPNPDWSRTYSPQPEILGYLERCVERYGLGRNLRLGTEVKRADFDPERGKWRLTTADGEEAEFDVLVSSCGQLSRPALTRIPGADRFEGPIFHTARWDHGVELEGQARRRDRDGREHDPGGSGDRGAGRPARRLSAFGAVRGPQEGPALSDLGEAAPAGVSARPAGAPFRAVAPVRALLLRLHAVQAPRQSRRPNRREEPRGPGQRSGASPRVQAQGRDRLQAGPRLERLLRHLRAAERRVDPAGRPRADEDRRDRGRRNGAGNRCGGVIDRLREPELPGPDGGPGHRWARAERRLARRAPAPTSA